MLAYSVLEEGGGAEGVVDRGVLTGDGAKRTTGAGVLALFSCSFKDMAKANCKSSSSCTGAATGEAEEEVDGPCDSWARELRRYSGGRSLSISAAAADALAPSLK